MIGDGGRATAIGADPISRDQVIVRVALQANTESRVSRNQIALGRVVHVVPVNTDGVGRATKDEDPCQPVGQCRIAYRIGANLVPLHDV